MSGEQRSGARRRADGRRLKVLVLTSTFPRWQGDTCPMFVADLCENLAKSMDVTVLAPGAHRAKSVERWGAYTVRRFRYGWPARTQRLADGAILPNIKRNPMLMAQVPPFVLAQLWAAYRLMRRERFDVIHAHWAVPQGVIASLLKRRFKVPVITTTHGGDIYALRSGVALRAKRWALRSSDRVTAVSSSLKNEVVTLGVAETRVHVLPMGVDARRFAGSANHLAVRQVLNPDGGPVLLFVGRLSEKKGVPYAIEAMVGILNSRPDARLAIVGDGPDRSKLESIADELGIAQRVSFLGARSNEELPAFYAAADVLLAPSIVADDGDREGVPVVLAEAMASGCAVVTTDVGGITDIVINGDTGVLVPQRDAVAIANAVVDLLQHPELRAGLTRRAAASIRARFDHQYLHSSYRELIKGVAA